MVETVALETALQKLDLGGIRHDEKGHRRNRSLAKFEMQEYRGTASALAACSMYRRPSARIHFHQVECPAISSSDRTQGLPGEVTVHLLQRHTLSEHDGIADTAVVGHQDSRDRNESCVDDTERMPGNCACMAVFDYSAVSQLRTQSLADPLWAAALHHKNIGCEGGNQRGNLVQAADVGEISVQGRARNVNPRISASAFPTPNAESVGASAIRSLVLYYKTFPQSSVPPALLPHLLY